MYTTMCGITGYVGAREASEVVLEGLRTLEYRGYDSAGVAAFVGDEIRVLKAVGKVSAVAEKIKAEGTLVGAHCGIGHTRWATHGAPSDRNSHPHGCDTLQIVHNGIIENYAPLREMLKANGYDFVSDTDTEVAAKLIAYTTRRSATRRTLSLRQCATSSARMPSPFSLRMSPT